MTLLAHTHVLLRLVVAFPPEKPVHLLASFSRPNFASLTSSKNNNNPRLFLDNSQKSTRIHDYSRHDGEHDLVEREIEERSTKIWTLTRPASQLRITSETIFLPSIFEAIPPRSKLRIGDGDVKHRVALEPGDRSKTVIAGSNGHGPSSSPARGSGLNEIIGFPLSRRQRVR